MNEDHEKMQILIAEDMIVQGKKLKFYLESFGYEVFWAKNGSQALKAVTDPDNNVGLIITDINMPEMSGFDLVNELMKRSISIPTVFITTLEKDEHIDTALRLKATDFIAKPFKPVELRLRIANIVKRIGSQKLVRKQLEIIEGSSDGIAILSDTYSHYYINSAYPGLQALI